MTAAGTDFRLRPRYGTLALAAAVVGLAIMVIGLVAATGASRTYAVGCGIAGVTLALLYRLSPVWRLRLRLNETGVSVLRGDELRLELGWGDVERVIVAADGESCYLWGGSVERSLLVAGPQARAPYIVDDRARLLTAITEAIGEERVERADDFDGVCKQLGQPESP